MWTLVGGGEPKKPLHPVVVLLVMVALVATDYFVFRLFDQKYFHWYLAQGAVMSLVVAVIAVAVELDQDQNLISTHPGKYAGAWLRVPGETFSNFAVIVRADNRAGLDGIFAGLIGLVLAALWVGWLVVVAPIQYFVTLVAGSPSRTAIASGQRTWVERREETTVIRSGPQELMPKAAEEVGVARRPVSVTSAFIAALLFGGSQFL